MKKITWVLVSTTSRKEAEKIGRALLSERLVACYGLYPKTKSVYFWPPRSGKLETSRGPLLVLETLPRHYARIARQVRQLHSDRVPFIGRLEIGGVGEDFYGWMEDEVAGNSGNLKAKR